MSLTRDILGGRSAIGRSWMALLDETDSFDGGHLHHRGDRVRVAATTERAPAAAVARRQTIRTAGLHSAHAAANPVPLAAPLPSFSASIRAYASGCLGVRIAGNCCTRRFMGWGRV